MMNNGDESTATPDRIDFSVISTPCQRCQETNAQAQYSGRLLCHACTTIEIDQAWAEIERIAAQLHPESEGSQS